MSPDLGARDPQLWAFLTAIALPGFISLVVKPQWTAFRKRCVAVLSIISTALFWVWITDQLDPTQIAATIRTVLVTVGAIYVLFRDNLKALQERGNS